MKRVVIVLLVFPILIFVSAMVMAEGPSRVPNIDPPAMPHLDWNQTSSGMLVDLDAEPGAPFYENEVQRLMVYADYTLSHPAENVSVQVLLGMDVLSQPEDESYAVVRFVNNILDGDEFVWRYMATLNITPGMSDRALIATLTFGNETVNLTYEMTVEPARAILGAELVTPPNLTGYEELTWTDLRIDLTNEGGLGVTGLVVDVHYSGLIVSTHHVNLVPPHGNTTITTQVKPLYGHEVVEVHVVSGPVPAGLLAGLSLNVTARPVLEVLGVEATPGEVTSGNKVHIQALLRNRGNGTSTGQQVELMVDGAVVANFSIEQLGPDEETTVTTNWTLTGKGTHTIAARAEGDEFAAMTVTVHVKEQAPGLVAWSAIIALCLVSWAARRSRSAGRP